MLVLTVLSIGMITVPAFADAPSPLKQFQMGIPFDMIKCNDEKILVEFSSGKPACLKSDTLIILSARGHYMMTLSQEISSDEKYASNDYSSSVKISDLKTSVDNHNVQFIHNLEKIKAEKDKVEIKIKNRDENGGIKTISPVMLFPGIQRYEISHIPKLDDVFEISVTVQTDPIYSSTHSISIFVSPEFEFIKESLPENATIAIEGDRTYVDYKTQQVEIGTLSVQARAISEGYGQLQGGAFYADSVPRKYIYVDKDNSFYYDRDTQPTINHLPRPVYSIDYADTLVLIEENQVSSSSGNGHEQGYTHDNVKDFATNHVDWSWEDYIDDKSYYKDMPKAKNVKTTIQIPQIISVGDTEIIKVTLKSIDRTNDYEHVLVNVATGPGIELDDENYSVYNNDIFAIGVNNTISIDYPIKATKPGTWILNFVVNDKLERHLLVVK